MNIVQVSTELVRGPRPSSPADLTFLRDHLGVRRVINLQGRLVEGRQVRQERGWADALGVAFVWHPWNWLSPPGSAAIRLALADIVGTTYVHCHDGVDRTGVFVAAYRRLAGTSFGRAFGEMFDRGFHLSRYFWWLPFLEAATRPAAP